jgi:ChrR-like protein with cupin domain
MMRAQFDAGIARLSEEEIMSTTFLSRRWPLVALLAAWVVLPPCGTAKSPDLNPAAIVYTLPDKIQWHDDPMGLKSAVLYGDPSKPGLYIMLVKWTPGHMSHPHFHPNDRFITVISGTWWVGTGPKFDPQSTVPLPAGTFVTHFGKQTHYDGAKDVEAVLQIVGEGPATATPAEQK